jgi:hypothetical protein
MYLIIKGLADEQKSAELHDVAEILDRTIRRIGLVVSRRETAVRDARGLPFGLLRLALRPLSPRALHHQHIASPAHQTHQVGQKALVGTLPETTSVSEPQVALTAMPRSAPKNTIASASRSRFNSSRNSALCRRATPRSGARVFPTAMLAAAKAE